MVLRKRQGTEAVLVTTQSWVNADFLLLSVAAVSALDFMQLGGKGGISVTTNVAENEMARYFSLAADGNYAAVRRLNQRLVPLHQKLFFEPSPIPVKWVYKTLGLMAKDTLHLPMTPLTEEGSGVLRQPLINVGFL